MDTLQRYRQCPKACRGVLPTAQSPYQEIPRHTAGKANLFYIYGHCTKKYRRPVKRNSRSESLKIL